MFETLKYSKATYIFLFSILFLAFYIMIFVSKKDDLEEKESSKHLISSLSALVISGFFVMMLYYIMVMRSKEIFLDEDFYD